MLEAGQGKYKHMLNKGAGAELYAPAWCNMGEQKWG